jgi:hypothetical protein
VGKKVKEQQELEGELYFRFRENIFLATIERLR